MVQKIEIITGEVRSGKTSRLRRWLAEHPHADGILSPVIKGKRYVQRIRSGEKRLLDATGNKDEAKLERVGRHVLLKKSFAWAQQELKAAAGETDYLVVDEIGLLELEGKGLEPLLSTVLQIFNGVLVVVVREGLLERVRECYDWKQAQVVNMQE
jgi:nucleoside-triphosphatase THEP1